MTYRTAPSEHRGRSVAAVILVAIVAVFSVIVVKSKQSAGNGNVSGEAGRSPERSMTFNADATRRTGSAHPSGHIRDGRPRASKPKNAEPARQDGDEESSPALKRKHPAPAVRAASKRSASPDTTGHLLLAALLLSVGALLGTGLSTIWLWRQLSKLQCVLRQSQERHVDDQRQFAHDTANLDRWARQQVSGLEHCWRQTQEQMANLERRLLATAPRLTPVGMAQSSGQARDSSVADRGPNGLPQGGWEWSRPAAEHPSGPDGQRAGEAAIPSDPDLEWIQECAAGIRSHRLAPGRIPDDILDRWVEVASRAECEERETALSSALADLMALARSELQLDIVRPAVGSSARQQSIDVVEAGPLDGVVAEVVAVGLRTREGVLRRARVKSRPKS